MDSKPLWIAAAAILVVAALLVFWPEPEAIVGPMGPIPVPTPAETAAVPEAASTAMASPSDETQSASVGVPPLLASRRVVATYFHNTARCYTCRTIEDRAKETMEATFAEEFASEKLVWRTVNMELPENEHYAADYQLVSPSLVLALMDGDREVRSAVLQDTWILIHKAARFEAYVIAETLGFLEEL